MQVVLKLAGVRPAVPYAPLSVELDLHCSALQAAVDAITARLAVLIMRVVEREQGRTCVSPPPSPIAGQGPGPA